MKDADHKQMSFAQSVKNKFESINELFSNSAPIKEAQIDEESSFNFSDEGNANANVVNSVRQF